MGRVGRVLDQPKSNPIVRISAKTSRYSHTTISGYSHLEDGCPLIRQTLASPTGSPLAQARIRQPKRRPARTRALNGLVPCSCRVPTVLASGSCLVVGHVVSCRALSRAVPSGGPSRPGPLDTTNYRTVFCVQLLPKEIIEDIIIGPVQLSGLDLY